MIVSKYLIINSKGTVSIKERFPSLKANEIAVRIQLEIPTQLFQRPVLEARMRIPDEAIPKSSITPSVTTNLEKIIKENTGLNMVVSVIEHEDENKDN